MLDQQKKFEIFNRIIALKAVLGLIILLAATTTITVSLVGIYANETSKAGISVTPKAKNVGNWEIINSDYVLKKHEELIIDGKNIGAVTLRDNKNGNKLIVFQAEFSLAEIARTKEDILNKLLAGYGLAGYYFKGSGTTGKYGMEIKYNFVGWSSVAGEKMGIIGNVDCPLGNGNKSGIFLIAVNSIGAYDNNRVLEFANTLKCLEITDNNGGDNPNDKLDTDKDGLIDTVEKMLHTNPFNADSDGDGASDGDEIKAGRNPSMHKQWNDIFTPEELAKIKRDIKFVSIYNYDNLFPTN